MRKLAIKFSFFTILISINTYVGYCQKMEELSDLIITDSIYTIVDEDADFPGGKGYLLKFIQENFSYPENYGDIDVMGKIYLKFVVSKTGMCSNFQILRGIEDPKLEKSVIDMLKKMPLWIPAKVEGKNVDSYFVLPIQLCFQ